MSQRPIGRALPAASVLFLIAAAFSSARADDFVDSRLTATFGDDDLLNDVDLEGMGTIGFGDRRGYELYHDNLNTKFSSRETLTHLVFYRKLPSFFENLTTEAALVMRLQLLHRGASAVTLEDTGSYIRLTFNPWDDPDDGLALTVFPFDSDRFRVGYLYDLSIGGREMFPKRTWFSAPGVRLWMDLGPGFYYAGFKALPTVTEPVNSASLQGLESPDSESRVLFSFLGGLGWDLMDDHLRVEVSVGYFEQAESPILDVAGELVTCVAGSFRAAYHHEMPVEDSLDVALYRNDPNRPFIAFAPVTYNPGELGYMVSAEFIGLAQRLAAPGLYGGTTSQGAFAGALLARVQHDYLRVGLSLASRSLPFMLMSRPSFVPYTALQDGVATSPEIMLSTAADYHFPSLHLTLGLSAGVLWPANIRTQLYATAAGSSANPTMIGVHTLIMYRQGATMVNTLLPDGEDAGPVFQSRLRLRFDISEMLYTMAWIQYGHDSNNSKLEVSPDLTKSRVLGEPNSFGLGVSAAVRL